MRYICAWCQKVVKEEGCWNCGGMAYFYQEAIPDVRIRASLRCANCWSDQADSNKVEKISHSICPECKKELEDEIKKAESVKELINIVTKILADEMAKKMGDLFIAEGILPTTLP